MEPEDAFERGRETAGLSDQRCRFPNWELKVFGGHRAASPSADRAQAGGGKNNGVCNPESLIYSAAAAESAAHYINNRVNPGSGNFTHDWLPRCVKPLPSILANLGRK